MTRKTRRKPRKSFCLTQRQTKGGSNLQKNPISSLLESIREQVDEDSLGSIIDTTLTVKKEDSSLALSAALPPLTDQEIEYGYNQNQLALLLSLLAGQKTLVQSIVAIVCSQGVLQSFVRMFMQTKMRYDKLIKATCTIEKMDVVIRTESQLIEPDGSKDPRLSLYGMFQCVKETSVSKVEPKVDTFVVFVSPSLCHWMTAYLLYYNRGKKLVFVVSPFLFEEETAVTSFPLQKLRFQSFLHTWLTMPGMDVYRETNKIHIICKKEEVVYTIQKNGHAEMNEYASTTPYFGKERKELSVTNFEIKSGEVNESFYRLHYLEGYRECDVETPAKFIDMEKIATCDATTFTQQWLQPSTCLQDFIKRRLGLTSENQTHAMIFRNHEFKEFFHKDVMAAIVFSGEESQVDKYECFLNSLNNIPFQHNDFFEIFSLWKTLYARKLAFIRMSTDVVDAWNEIVNQTIYSISNRKWQDDLYKKIRFIQQLKNLSLGEKDFEIVRELDESSDPNNNENIIISPSDNSSNPPSDNSSNPPSDNSSNLPSDNSSNPPSDNSSNLPSNNSTNLPSNNSTNLPSNNSTNPPSDNSTNPPSEQRMTGGGTESKRDAFTPLENAILGKLNKILDISDVCFGTKYGVYSPYFHKREACLLLLQIIACFSTQGEDIMVPLTETSSMPVPMTEEEKKLLFQYETTILEENVVAIQYFFKKNQKQRWVKDGTKKTLNPNTISLQPSEIGSKEMMQLDYSHKIRNMVYKYVVIVTQIIERGEQLADTIIQEVTEGYETIDFDRPQTKTWGWQNKLEQVWSQYAKQKSRLNKLLQKGYKTVLENKFAKVAARYDTANPQDKETQKEEWLNFIKILYNTTTMAPHFVCTSALGMAGTVALTTGTTTVAGSIAHPTFLMVPIGLAAAAFTHSIPVVTALASSVAHSVGMSFQMTAGALVQSPACLYCMVMTLNFFRRMRYFVSPLVPLVGNGKAKDYANSLQNNVSSFINPPVRPSPISESPIVTHVVPFGPAPRTISGKILDRIRKYPKDLRKTFNHFIDGSTYPRTYAAMNRFINLLARTQAGENIPINEIDNTAGNVVNNIQSERISQYAQSFIQSLQSLQRIIRGQQTGEQEVVVEQQGQGLFNRLATGVRELMAWIQNYNVELSDDSSDSSDSSNSNNSMTTDRFNLNSSSNQSESESESNDIQSVTSDTNLDKITQNQLTYTDDKLQFLEEEEEKNEDTIINEIFSKRGKEFRDIQNYYFSKQNLPLNDNNNNLIKRQINNIDIFKIAYKKYKNYINTKNSII